MVTLDGLRKERREEILRLATLHGAQDVRIFGSVARDESNENSDLDLLVSWEPGRSLLDHSTGMYATRSFARQPLCEG